MIHYVRLAALTFAIASAVSFRGCWGGSSQSNRDATSSVKKDAAAQPNGAQHNTATLSLTGPCPTRPNKQPPQPDKMDLLFKSIKRYRLVIGAGTFKRPEDRKEQRTYVEPTAKLVDARLSQLSYQSLPTLKVPYLIGKNATLSNIRKALDAMRSVVGPDDLGIIYYVGHGIITDNHDDLSLAVYDRPVTTGEGIRVSDILGILQVKTYHKNIPEIPHFLIVLDTCYSGNAAKPQTVAIDESNGLQTIVYAQNRAVVPQIAILSATAPGSGNEAYGLENKNLSAFGYYFARALDEDWECADIDSPDGIMTLDELKFYLKQKLDTAQKLGAIDAVMKPTMLNGIEKSFIAYDGRHFSVPGARSEILDVAVDVPQGQYATIVLPSGSELGCWGKQHCSFLLAKSNIGNVTVVLQPKLDLGTGPTDSNLNTLAGRIMLRPNSADIDSIGKRARERPDDIVHLNLGGLQVDNVDVKRLIQDGHVSVLGLTLNATDGKDGKS